MCGVSVIYYLHKPTFHREDDDDDDDDVNTKM